MLAKSHGFSRQLTRWAACLVSTGAILINAPSAQALLEDSEKKTLNEVFEAYKRSKTVGEYIRNNRGYLDPDSYAFLMKQTNDIAKQRLPKISVHGDSRISFKIDGIPYKIDFISVRTQLLALNGTEIEFMPGDTPEAKFGKVMAALEYKNAAFNPLLQLLEPFASAAPATGGNVDPKRVSVIKSNLNSLASIVQTMLSVAREKNTPCAERNRKIKELMSIYNRKPEGYDEAKQKAIAEHPGVPVARGDLATEEDFTKQKYACQPYDLVDLSEKDIDDLKNAGASAGIEVKFYADDALSDPAELKPEQLNSLSQKNFLNMTYKWKLQQIRKSLVELQKAETGNRTCYAEAVGLVQEFLGKVKKSTKTGRLRCYIDQVAKDIKEGNSTAPVPIVPPSGMGPAGKANK